jgi:hypothetical protein
MFVRRWLKFSVEQNRRSRRSRSAISTIIANLLMLVIVVTLSSILFVWAISSLGSYQGGAGAWFSSRSIANQERPSVENVFFAQSSNCPGSYAYCVTVYIRNVGTIPFTVGSIYINSTLYTQSSPSILVSQVQQFQFPLIGQSLVKGDLQTLTVATIRGTVVTTTWAY